MTKVAAASTSETRLADSDPAHASGGDPGPRPSREPEADKIRRQMHLRRKIKLARRALAAHRR